MNAVVTVGVYVNGMDPKDVVVVIGAAIAAAFAYLFAAIAAFVGLLLGHDVSPQAPSFRERESVAVTAAG